MLELGIDACSGTIHNSSTPADSGTIEARAGGPGEYLLGPSAFGTWISQRVSAARSRNPGTDYECLKVLASKKVANGGQSMVDKRESTETESTEASVSNAYFAINKPPYQQQREARTTAAEKLEHSWPKG